MFGKCVDSKGMVVLLDSHGTSVLLAHLHEFRIETWSMSWRVPTV